MKIKELLEALSEVKKYISEIRINGYYKFDGFDEYNISKKLGIDGDEFDVKSWKVSLECHKVVLIIYAEDSQDQDSEEDEEKEEEELTVSGVLENIYFDDENTILIFDKTGSKVYDSDEDDVFAMCELLCLDVREYAQIHRGNHQTIEIHLKSY